MTNFSNTSLPPEHFTQGTTPCHFFPTYHPVSNYRECTHNDASSIPACWQLVKNRNVYWVGVPFTMVNMCVPGQWRVDGFAAEWHLIYGCMQGEGWSRPPLSLNQIISAPGKTNDGCKLASIAWLTSSSCSFTVELFSLSSFTHSQNIVQPSIIWQCDKIFYSLMQFLALN